MRWEVGKSYFLLVRFRSPRSPWPLLDSVLALRRRSCASERPTSSLSLNCPAAPRRTNRLSVPVLMSSRFEDVRRVFVGIDAPLVLNEHTGCPQTARRWKIWFEAAWLRRGYD